MEDSRIEEKLDKIDGKVDQLNETNHQQDLKLERLSVISEENQKTLGENKEVLAEHARRSTASEKRLNLMEGFFKGLGVVVVLLGIVLTLQRLGLI